MPRGNLKFSITAALLFCLFITAARGTTVIPPTFEEMVDRADLVFEGRVVNVRSEWSYVQIQPTIYTWVEFEVQEVLKGSAKSVTTLQFLGGTVGDVTLEVAGVPKFSRGERVLLFVEGNGVQFCPIVGVFHGNFGIRRDGKTGREVVAMHNGKPLRDVSEIGSAQGAEFGPKRTKLVVPADPPEAMSVEAFKNCIHTRLKMNRTP